MLKDANAKAQLPTSGYGYMMVVEPTVEDANEIESLAAKLLPDAAFAEIFQQFNFDDSNFLDAGNVCSLQYAEAVF